MHVEFYDCGMTDSNLNNLYLFLQTEEFSGISKLKRNKLITCRQGQDYQLNSILAFKIYSIFQFGV